jgi:hypothetical protein
VGGERWVAIVAVSWSCLYSSAVRSLSIVCSDAARKYIRQFVGVGLAKAGLWMEHVSRVGLGVLVMVRMMVGVYCRSR